MTDASQSSSNQMVPHGIAGTAHGQAALQISASGLHFCEKRGLSKATLGKLAVASGTAYFPALERKTEGIFFKYPNGWKARAISDKDFVSNKGFEIQFWNLENVLKENPDTVYITEGEFDCLALVEAGIDPFSVLSVPNGAKEKVANEPKELRGYAYVEKALEAGLNKIKKIVWCGDGDSAGYSLREDMVNLLGAARFHFIDWPEGIKDANEMLLKDGADALRELVEHGCLQWPVKGLYRMWELPEPPKMVLWNPGFPQWESKVLLAPKTLSVVTGHAGMGKTQLWNQIWFQICRSYCVPICMASFETRPKPHLRRQLRSLFIGKLEKHLSPEEVDRADKWINERYLFLVHPEQRPTLEWFLDMAEIAVVRHEARIIQLDPWNRLEASRTRDETETEYIARCLRTLHVFANDMNCHVQIVAHPAKADAQNRGKPPTLEDIAGSKHWENMVDQGFVVHRPEIFDGTNRKTEAALYHRKARFEELGYPCKLSLNYNLDNGAYVSTDYAIY